MCRPRVPYYEEVYHDFTIKIFNDEDGQHLDPYKNGDGMFPMLVNAGRGSNHDYLDAGGVFIPSVNQYRRHKRALLKAVGFTDEGDYETAQQVYDDVCDTIGELVRSYSLDELEAIGKILGIPCYKRTLRGYSQSDWADVLVVWTPEFAKTTGMTKKQALADGGKEMLMNAKIWGAWAWGDIFGFEITDHNGKEFSDNSCRGFVEPNTWPPEKMGVVEEARMSVDAEIEWRKKQHAKQLKTYIRNHVPLMYRQHLELR